MKLNQHTALVGPDVILVPYRPEHVEKYHQWMLSDELRELTASEPLTLEEEYEMQRKWLEDEDKLTFIILSKPQRSDTNKEPQNHFNQEESAKFDISSSPMIGDINLFLKGFPTDDDFESEVEIMIAGDFEPTYRRRGFARQALEIFLTYVISSDASPLLSVQPTHLVARIGENNIPSIRMFQKLGFTITRRVTVFEEVEMRLDPDSISSESWSKGELATC